MAYQLEILSKDLTEQFGEGNAFFTLVRATDKDTFKPFPCNDVMVREAVAESNDLMNALVELHSFLADRCRQKNVGIDCIQGIVSFLLPKFRS